MKFATFFAAVFFLVPLARAQRIVELDLLIVRLSEVEALPLVNDLRDPKSAAAARDTILNLIASKHATLIDWPVLETPSGQRAIVEHIREVRYASKYEAPGTAKIVETTEKIPAQAGETGQVRITKAETVTEGVPTEFDTRNTGITMEVEPIVSKDDTSIQVNLVVQHVEVTGYRKVEIHQKESAKTVVVEQPEIVNHKVTTVIHAQDGGATLLNVTKLEQPKEQVQLFILGARVKRLGDGEAVRFPPPKPQPPADNAPPVPPQ